MGFDPKIYRSPKDAFGSPDDPQATNATDAWTAVALLKGMLAKLTTLVAGSGASSVVADDSAFTLGANVSVMGAFADETSPDAVDEGDAGALRMTLNRALHVNFRSASGAELNFPALFTDDGAFTPGSGGVNIMGAFADEASPDLVDEGDGGALRMTLARGLHVNFRDASGNPLALGSGTVNAQTLRAVLAQDDPAAVSLAIMDDWDEADRAKVNLINGQTTGVAGGAGATSAATLRVVLANDDALTGATNETAPASDTATSGINGRLQRVAQRITSLIAQVPATLGQKTMANSLAVVVASDQTVTTQLGAASNASTTAYAASLVVKAAAGTLYGLSGHSSKGAAQFIQIHDAASVPADTAVPKVIIKVQADSTFSVDFGPRGRAFDTGIVVCNSSTGPTKTIGSTDTWIDAQFA